MTKQLTILISAGPTIEPLDPVRYLSNRSSGKMGYALAEAALALGHKVILVSGPTHLEPPKGVEFFPVKTAREMKDQMDQVFEHVDLVFKAAAVADYRPFRVPTQKMKKKSPLLSLFLLKNPDILKGLGRKKTHQVLVGFAAETENGVRHALKKMRDKNLDWIVLNDVSRTDIGFESEQNEVMLLGKDEQQFLIPKQEKQQIAKQILQHVLENL